MTHATFSVTFLSLILLGISLVATIARPQWRVWPPPRRASWQYWYTWGLTGLAMLGTTILGILDWNTFSLPPWLRTAGGLLALSGAFFALWGVRELGTRASQGLGGELATTGPYRYSRNPQYVGDIALLLGFGLLCNSVLTLVAVTLGIVWFALAPFAEEPWLRERLGSSYEEYARQVPRFLGRSSAARLPWKSRGALTESWRAAMDPEKVEARIAEARRSFDAELHTKAYAETHSDPAQLVRLLSFLSPGRDHVILDLGTGNGYAAMAIAGAHPGCRVIGVDIATQAIDRGIEQARLQGLANAAFQNYDGIALPFADDHFDAAICRYAFHHLPQPPTTLDELGRTVRSGGRLVLADAIRDDADDVNFVNRFQELKRDGHVRMHRATDLLDLVSRHGFDLIDCFESPIFFTRERTAEYDELLAMTPERVLQAYSLTVAEREMRLRFRILNALFVKTSPGDDAWT